MKDLRFTQIIDAYGSRSDRWPEAERQAMLRYIRSHASAQQYISREASLDELLDTDLHEQLQADRHKKLEAIIMGNLPASQPLRPLRADEALVDRLLAWLLPTCTNNEFWRPAIVACLPLLVGLAIGSNVSLEILDDSYTWDEQAYLLGLSADAVFVDSPSIDRPSLDILEAP